MTDPGPTKILLVEDEEAHAELVRRAFLARGCGASVVVARNLREARTRLTDARPDLVIADWLLPDGKGTDLLSCSDGAAPNLPLVVMTAHGSESVAVEAIKAGAIDYVVKSETALAEMPRVAERAMRQWSNVVERRKAEAERDHYSQRLRALASQLVLAEERERRRIAVFLHDRVGQALATLRLKIRNHRERVQSEECRCALDGFLALVDEAIRDTRSLTFDLSPPILYELGFEPALEWLVDGMREQHGLRVKFSCDPAPKPLDGDVRTVLFLGVREVLHNVVKHARAKSVSVSVSRQDDVVRVTVADDGCGFDAAAVCAPGSRTAGFGLFSIRERLGYLGGSVEVDSAPGKGTRVVLAAPLAGEGGGA